LELLEQFPIVPLEELRLRMPEMLAIRTASEASVGTQPSPFADEFPFNDEEEAYPTTLIPGGHSELVRDWSPAQQRALAELIGWTVIRQEWPASAGIAELIRGARRPGESANEDRPPGNSPELMPVSSLALGTSPAAPAGGFWFNVNAELVVYGATEPDATVLVGGRPVRLRPDGTFSVRFALPDGAHQLPVTAVSARGEMRTAQLDFARSTAYSEGTSAHPQDPELKAPSAE
jgi:hypothetical protein